MKLLALLPRSWLLSAGLMAAASLLSPFGVRAQAAPVLSLPALITTQGGAEMRVPPDRADLRFDIEVRQADLAGARREQAARMDRLLAALRKAGVAEGDLSTSQLQLNVLYAAPRPGESVSLRIDGYAVSQSVDCTLNQVDKVAEVTSAAIRAGATGLGEVQLRTSELKKHRDEVRRQALRAARDKAVLMAAELGAKVGKPYQIREGAGSESFAPLRMLAQSRMATLSASMADMAPAAIGTFVSGLITVSTTVEVAFLLE